MGAARDMSLPAFYLPPEEWGPRPCLRGDEARHANVLRLEPGNKVMIMNGIGLSAICRVVKMDKRELALEMEKEWLTPAPDAKAVIAIALSKAVRRGFFLEKAAEFGAWAIWLWQAERSQGKLAPSMQNASLAQLRAGAKQCHNPWFPQIASFNSAKTLAEAAQSTDWRLLPWEEMAGEAIIAKEQLARAGITIFVIGPEGGLAQWEVDALLEAGFQTVSLGSRVFRCETAATFCLALHCWAAQSA